MGFRAPSGMNAAQRARLDSVESDVAGLESDLANVATPDGLAASLGQALAPVQSFDAFMEDRLQRADQFIKYLTDNGIQGHIGEIGWPNDSPYSTIDENPYRWNALAANVLQRFLNAGVWVTPFHASTVSDHDLRAIYGMPTGTANQVPLSQPNTQAAVVEGLWVPENQRVGISISTGSTLQFVAGFTNEALPTGWTYSPTGKVMVAGVNLYGSPTRMSGPSAKAYNYLDPESFAFLGSRPNLDHVRLEVCWELIQPVLNGALNEPEMVRIDEAIASAAANDLDVILDVHNFGAYSLAAGKQWIGHASVPVAAFGDLWSRLSSRYKDNAAVIAYDLMNEPGGATNWTGAAGAAQAAITAIRNNSDTTLLLIEVLSGVMPERTSTWSSFSLTDPAANFRISAHYYFDNTANAGGNSTYALSYAAYLASAQAKKAQPDTPQPQPQPLAPASGGATVDTEARTSLANVITLLERAGIAPAHLQAIDTFDRADASSLGTATDGHVWSPGTNWSIVSNDAKPTVVNASQLIDTQASDGIVQAAFLLSSGNSEVGVQMRYVSSTARLTLLLKASGATSSVTLSRAAPGVGTSPLDIVSFTGGTGLTPGSVYTARVKLAGSIIYATVYEGDGTGGAVVAQLQGQLYGTERALFDNIATHGLVAGATEDTGSRCKNFRVETLDFAEIGQDGLALPPLGAYVGQSRANDYETAYSIAAANPKELTGWWDASQLGLAADAAVAGWPGVFGQTPRGTGAAQPQYKTAVQNGLAVVRFTAADSDKLSASGVVANTDGVQEIYVVGRYTPATFAGFNGLVGGTGHLGLIGNGAGTTRWLADAGFSAYYDDLSGTNKISTMPAPVNDAFKVMCLTYTTAQGVSTGWNINLGQDRGVAGRFWAGDIAEVIQYSVARSSTDRLALLTRLKAKWGL